MEAIRADPLDPFRAIEPISELTNITLGREHRIEAALAFC